MKEERLSQNGRSLFFAHIEQLNNYTLKKIDITEKEWQIIANPNAMTAQRDILKHKILHELGQRGFRYETNIADGAGSGIEIAERLCREGKRHFIVVGGDGSVNEVVNGIYKSGIETEEIFLGIIPLGTGNDFCRTMRYPTVDRIVPFLLEGQFRLTDVGLVETISEGQLIDKRHFINIAGFAFDAAVINETIKGKPRFFRSAVYLSKLIKVLFKYKSTPVTIKEDDHTFTQKTFTIAVGNAQYNGNGMRQVPMADPHDGKLDAVIIRKLSPMKVLRNVKRLFTGKHIAMQEVKVIRTQCIEISAKNQILGEVEGELLTKGNYRVRILPNRLNILTTY